MQVLNCFKNLKPVIAIDGTAGSGKGTLAKSLAIKLNFDHLDTGILYRIYAFETQNKKIIDSINLSEWINNDKKLARLRTDKISKIASKISQKKVVRSNLIKIQRDFANNPPGKNGSIIQLNLNSDELQNTLKNIIERDKQDIEREISPLKKAKDSFIIDTSNINETEALAMALNHIKKKTDFI